MRGRNFQRDRSNYRIITLFRFDPETTCREQKSEMAIAFNSVFVYTNKTTKRS